MKKKIVFLVSSNGGSLKFIYYALENCYNDIEIVGVIGDRTCGAIEFAKSKEIYAKKIKYSRTNNAELRNELQILDPDLIITTISKIIDIETLNSFPNKFINLHYSLLPSFEGLMGMDTVRKAKAKNVKFIGGTCHEVTEFVDDGPIICQSCLSIDWAKEVYEDVVEIVFKISCISLLIGILIKLKISMNPGSSGILKINKKTITFAPLLDIDCALFDELFWNRIKN